MFARPVFTSNMFQGLTFEDIEEQEVDLHETIFEKVSQITDQKPSKQVTLPAAGQKHVGLDAALVVRQVKDTAKKESAEAEEEGTTEDPFQDLFDDVVVEPKWTVSSTKKDRNIEKTLDCHFEVFKPKKKEDLREIRSDRTRLSVDCRVGSKTPGEFAKEHMINKMAIFKETCVYIAAKKEVLKAYTFPITVDGQYSAHYISVDPLAINKGSNGGTYILKTTETHKYECTHVSLLNKILVQKDGRLFVLNSDILYKNKNINIHDFLNTCSIAPKAVNKIDNFIEFVARIEATKKFDSIVRGTLTPEEATLQITNKCLTALKTLEMMIKPASNKVARANKNLARIKASKLIDNYFKHFYIQEKLDTEFITKHDTYLPYIEGMIKGLEEVLNNKGEEKKEEKKSERKRS